MNSYSFNGNKSRIVLAWSPVNAAWLVWREDGGHQALVETHQSREAATADYRNRIAFTRELAA